MIPDDYLNSVKTIVSSVLLEIVGYKITGEDWVRTSEEVARRIGLLDSQPRMPEPDWSQAPAGYIYRTIDSDGEVWWHEIEPHRDNAGWESDGMALDDGYIELPIGIDWRMTLQERPRETSE